MTYQISEKLIQLKKLGIKVKLKSVSSRKESGVYSFLCELYNNEIAFQRTGRPI